MSHRPANRSSRTMSAKTARYFPARKRTRSEMVAPIISNDEVIGVFDLESDRLNAYTEDDLADFAAADLAGCDNYRKG